MVAAEPRRQAGRDDTRHPALTASTKPTAVYVRQSVSGSEFPL